jgi:flagellar M-ring protein FliF
MPQFLRQIIEQAKKVWTGFSRTQQIILAGALSFIAVVLVLVAIWAGRAEFVVLYSNLKAEDANAMVEKLKERKVEYRLADNGKAILVPQEQVYETRLAMAGDGLPKGGTVGFEIFEKAGFGVTAFKQKVDYMRALQGELERTIMKFDEVEMARVHLVLPDEKLFSEDQKSATASIIVGLKAGTELSLAQIKAIANLAARSVEGLDPKDITIVDTDMNILSDLLIKADDKNKLPTEASLEQDKIKKEWEEYYKHQVESMLQKVLGPNRAVARVFVELDFDKKELLSEVYKPVVGDEGIVRSSEETEESYQGTGTLPGGIPGTSSNIPGYQAKESEKTNAAYEKRHVIKNYEITKDVLTNKIAPGMVRRLSVSVLVDRLTDTTTLTVQEVVKAAVGYNQERGDQIAVRSLPFDRSLKEDLEKEKLAEATRKQRETMLALGVLGAFLLVILFSLVVVFRKGRRKTSLVKFKPVGEDQLVEQLVAAEPPVPPEPPAPPEEITPEEEKREAVANLAKNNPEEFALLLKTWLITSKGKD